MTLVMEAVALVVLFGASPERYEWPLDLPRSLTSSFAEYRPGRFHAGIDLRTQGVGKDVRAAGDGYVSRIRCSAWGYGKAVYLQLDDGYTAVYAHLDGFRDDLEQYVRSSQHAQESYEVDLYPEPGRFTVTRGEVIAASGQTGSGPPHLHYELRDEHQRPVNPRLLGISWPDESVPRLRQLAIVPGDPEALVNGDHVPLIVEPRYEGEGRYTCPPVRARGRVGFAIETVDLSNNGANRLGVYTVRVTAAGRQVFLMKNDLLSYDNIRHGRVAYHPFLMDSGRFLVQWRWPGNEAPPYQHGEEDGWFYVSEEQTDVVIGVADFMGNEAILTVPVQLHDGAEPPPPDHIEVSSEGNSQVSVDCSGDFLVVSAVFRHSEKEPPLLRLDDTQAVAFRRIDGRTFRAAYRPDVAKDRVTVAVEHPRLEPFSQTFDVARRGRARSLHYGDLHVFLDADSPWDVLYCRGQEVPPPIKSQVTWRGPAYDLWPGDAPIDALVTLSFPVPESAENPDRLGIYYAGSRSWSRLSTRLEGDRLVASSRGLGTFAVMEDNDPPRLRQVLPSEGYHAATKRPYVRAQVSDAGGGIAHYRVTCADKWLLVEYDPQIGRLQWVRDHDLPSGRQQVVFEVTDTAGNVTTLRRHVHIP